MTKLAWSDQVGVLTQFAKYDLHHGHGIKPILIAFKGEQPLFIAVLRPFDRGEHRDPIIEVGAIAMGLGADRIILSLEALVWSLDDPIPPVCEEGDLRQPVLVIHEITEAGERTLITPFTGTEFGETVVIGTVTVLDGYGWVPIALRMMVNAPPSDAEHVVYQIQRCSALGHTIGLGVSI